MKSAVRRRSSRCSTCCTTTTSRARRNDSLDLLGRERFLAGEANSAARAAGIATNPRDEKSTAPQPVPDPNDFVRPKDRLRASGYRAGRWAGRAAVNDTTTEEECEEILRQIDDGSFEAAGPFSGDGWTPEKAYEDAGVPLRPEDDPADAFPELAVWEQGFRSGYTYQAEIDAESAHDGPNVLRKQTHPAEEK